MTEQDLKIQDLRAENEKLREEIEQLKQPKAVVDIERLTYRDEKGNPHSDHIMWDIINRLAEYEDLEEQGLLLKLPCPYGTIVYEVTNYGVKGHWEEDKYFVDEWSGLIVRERKFNRYMFAEESIGKTVFLTEQEAQAALDKMEGE